MATPSEATSKTALDSLKELDDFGSEGLSTIDSGWPRLDIPQLLRTALALGLAGAGAAVGTAGLAVIGYLLVTRALSPAQLRYTRPLPLDLSGGDLVAQASMLPAAAPAAAAAAAFLRPGDEVDVWVDFLVPSPRGGGAWGSHSGLAHVVAELVTADGATAARAAQPALLRPRRATLRRALTAPLRWVGALDDTQVVSVRLLKRYRERPDARFAVFQVAVKSRSAADPPEVLAAWVRVQLRPGLVGRLTYALRPRPLAALALGGAALAAAAGGTAVAAVALAALVYMWWARAETGAAEWGELAGGGGGASPAGSEGPEPSEEEPSERERLADAEGEGEADAQERARRGRSGAEWRKLIEEVEQEAPGRGEPLPSGGSSEAAATARAPSSAALRFRSGGGAA